MRRMETAQTSRTNWTDQENIVQQPTNRPEKKQEQTVDIEDDYFKLNPWYNQQKDKPVFGLASPLPRTVRKGMWWGRSALRNPLDKVAEDNNGDGVDRHDGLEFEQGKG